MAMRLVVCSLKTGGPQRIPPDEYTILRFPFNAESHDPDDLHPALQPDTGQTVTSADDRAGLIWPKHTAWATLNALIYWEAGGYTEVRDRFVRNPLNLPGAPPYDSTCTEDHPKTPGGQYLAKTWNLFVHPLTPLGLLLQHDAPGPVAVTLAEFKLSYWVDVPE